LQLLDKEEIITNISSISTPHFEKSIKVDKYTYVIKVFKQPIEGKTDKEEIKPLNRNITIEIPA